MKYKYMPLLILGKRQCGKSTALVRFAKGLPKVKGFAPTSMQGKYVFKNMNHDTPHSIVEEKEPINMRWVVDEFSHCSSVPKGQIMALTDDIDNFHGILKRLKKLGYPIT